MASPEQHKAVYSAALQLLQSRLTDPRLVADEYRTLVECDRQISSTTVTATQPGNVPKNRYVNVLPYDHNRVLLSATPSGASDYINASHVGHTDPVGFSTSYIATQGPLPGTISDFWQMVLEQRCGCIVMLTNTHERGMAKCAQCFPARPEDPPLQLRGGLSLTLLESQLLEGGDLTRRTLRLDHAPSGTSLLVTHLNYHAWPDHGTPEDCSAIRAMCDAMAPLSAAPSSSLSSAAAASTSATCSHQPSSSRHSHHHHQQQQPHHHPQSNQAGQQHQQPPKPGSTGPAVVHCSAGIGRTGTLIALDIIRQRLRALAARGAGNVSARELHEALDLPALVHALRRQRVGMVQTLEQYVFVYRALAEELRGLVGVVQQQPGQQQQQHRRR